MHFTKASKPVYLECYEVILLREENIWTFLQVK